LPGERTDANGKGAATGDEPARLRVGSLKENPGRGSGMEQARQPESEQTVEKSRKLEDGT